MLLPYEYSVSPIVALLAEGVDRNNVPCRIIWDHFKVALLAEGVDRNKTLSKHTAVVWWSPSSRRAWIEIPTTQSSRTSPMGRPPRGGRG